MFRIDMRDSIREWKEISPDLTRGDTILGNRYPAITSIAQSDLDPLRLYAGTQDGLIWTTADGGLFWENITDGTPGFYVTSITCSTIHPDGVIVTYSGYRDNDHQPYIFRSENAGLEWNAIQSDLPMMGVNSFYILPGWNDAILFAATDGGVYVSLDAGSGWERLGSNFPYMPVYDLDFNPVANTLIAATFSRGIMTFPIEELDLVSSTRNPGATMLSGVQIYPTIVQNHLTLDFTNFSGQRGNATVPFLSTSGELIYSSQVVVEVGKKDEIVLDRRFSPGLYLVNVKLGNANAVSKIMVVE
jgi:hypothetical protein